MKQCKVSNTAEQSMQCGRTEYAEQRSAKSSCLQRLAWSFYEQLAWSQEEQLAWRNDDAGGKEKRFALKGPVTRDFSPVCIFKLSSIRLHGATSLKPPGATSLRLRGATSREKRRRPREGEAIGLKRLFNKWKVYSIQSIQYTKYTVYEVYSIQITQYRRHTV